MLGIRSRWLRSLAAVAILGAATVAMAAVKIELKDPKGDDNGPGTYTYPTDQVYTPGSFDLLGVDIEDKGDDVIFKVNVNARIEDPWGSSGWGGNGFSIQHIQIYIDTDHKDGSGFTDALPGIFAHFKADEAWDKCVIIHAQGNTRVKSELDTKAPKMSGAVVLPKKVQATGKTLTATVSKADLGDPQPGWGYQVIVQSNEGFPEPTEVLTRKVNEFEGQHRFGGGSDFDGDPQIIDMLAGAAKGDASEADEQHKILKDYTADADPAKQKWATIPMIYPQK